MNRLEQWIAEIAKTETGVKAALQVKARCISRKEHQKALWLLENCVISLMEMMESMRGGIKNLEVVLKNQGVVFPELPPDTEKKNTPPPKGPRGKPPRIYIVK